MEISFLWTRALGYSSSRILLYFSDDLFSKTWNKLESNVTLTFEPCINFAKSGLTLFIVSASLFISLQLIDFLLRYYYLVDGQFLSGCKISNHINSISLSTLNNSSTCLDKKTFVHAINNPFLKQSPVPTTCRTNYSKNARKGCSNFSQIDSAFSDIKFSETDV